jgi:hypothetical protein
MPGMDQHNNCAYEIWRRGQEQGINVILAKSGHHTEKKKKTSVLMLIFLSENVYIPWEKSGHSTGSGAAVDDAKQ